MPCALSDLRPALEAAAGLAGVLAQDRRALQALFEQRGVRAQGLRGAGELGLRRLLTGLAALLEAALRGRDGAGELLAGDALLLREGGVGLGWTCARPLLAARDALLDRARRHLRDLLDVRDRLGHRRLDRRRGLAALLLERLADLRALATTRPRRPARPPSGPCPTSRPDLRGDLRVALGRGVVDAPARARWLCALLAAESIEPRPSTWWRSPAARPWAANVEPVCVA